LVLRTTRPVCINWAEATLRVFHETIGWNILGCLSGSPKRRLNRSRLAARHEPERAIALDRTISASARSSVVDSVWESVAFRGGAIRLALLLPPSAQPRPRTALSRLDRTSLLHSTWQGQSYPWATTLRSPIACFILTSVAALITACSRRRRKEGRVHWPWYLHGHRRRPQRSQEGCRSPTASSAARCVSLYVEESIGRSSRRRRG
jgi:hypothetical protein